jgi:hypothetical protein
VTVALGPHAALTYRLRTRPPCADGICVVSEHRDLARLEAAVAKRRVRDEAGEAAADNRAALSHGGYFTEPASIP